MQFAQCDDAFYAIKFFLARREFADEVAQYEDVVLRAVLPALLHACANADGALRSRSGYVYPPHIVLVRSAVLSSACFCWTALERAAE